MSSVTSLQRDGDAFRYISAHCQCSNLDSLRVIQALRGDLSFESWGWIIHNQELIIYSSEHRGRSIRTAIDVEDWELHPWNRPSNWNFDNFGQLHMKLKRCRQTWNLFCKLREAGIVK